MYAIAQTPFDGDNNLLWEDFESECDFVARSGAHGLVWPVMASEFTMISYPKRVEGMRRAVRTAAGRVPVVNGVADTSAHGAVSLVREAGEAAGDVPFSYNTGLVWGGLPLGKSIARTAAPA